VNKGAGLFVAENIPFKKYIVSFFESLRFQMTLDAGFIFFIQSKIREKRGCKWYEVNIFHYSPDGKANICKTHREYMNLPPDWPETSQFPE